MRAQIDGLGGGISSLSKCCIVGKASGDLAERADVTYRSSLPPPFTPHAAGLPGAQPAATGRVNLDARHDRQGTKLGGGRCEVASGYRFGQVEVRQPRIDWSAACGNIGSAAAHFAILHKLVPVQEGITAVRARGPSTAR
jgi:2-methylaconitate cis-trans-isomerase PrpF